MVRGDSYLLKELHKLRILGLYNCKVKEHLSGVEELLLRRTEVVAKAHEHSKLAPNWEGPYIICEQVYLDTYRLIMH